MRRRVLRAFRRRKLLDEAAAADMLTWQANGGFSVDASVRVEGHDREGVERLVRYGAPITRRDRPTVPCVRDLQNWSIERAGEDDLARPSRLRIPPPTNER